MECNSQSQPANSASSRSTPSETVPSKGKKPRARLHLLSLPNETIHQILSYLSPLGLSSIRQTCRQLKDSTQNDLLWRNVVWRNIRGPNPESLPSGSSSWRELYLSKHPFWFLPRYAVWFGDGNHYGKLLLARYDHRINAIEAYTLTAEKKSLVGLFWSYNMDVLIQPFDPAIKLDLNKPVLRLDSNSWIAPPPRPAQGDDYGSRVSDDTSPTYAEGHRPFPIDREVVMEVPNEHPIFTQLVPAKHLPPAGIGPQTSVWPPPTIPSPSRVLNQTSTHYQSAGFTPHRYREVSQHAFRLRSFPAFGRIEGTRTTDPVNYRPPTLPALGGNRVLAYFASHGARIPGGRYPPPAIDSQSVETYATLDPQLYTPTPEKPWRGIWCGDYSGHGCEFVCVMQPDDPAPPLLEEEGIMEAIQRIPPPGLTAKVTNRDQSPHPTPQSTNDSDIPIASGASSSTQEAQSSDPTSSQSEGANKKARGPVYSGRIEAVKLTGDPNVPRGQYTFVAPDISDEGLIRIADEDIFRGARVVRSVGHIAAPFFRDDEYVPSQLILISENRIAQYWQEFGHISFFQRVDIDKFLNVDG